MAMNARTFAVVGGGLAAGKAVQTLRDEGFDGRVVLFGDEHRLPYERPPLSKGVLLGADDEKVPFLHDEAWYAAQKIDVRTGTRIEAVDTAAKNVMIEGGERLSYDKLLIATGSRARRLSLPGGDLNGVHYLRTLPECLALRAAFQAGGRVVIVGAGWIGLETAAAARHYGCDVVVVEPEAVPLAQALGPEMGEVFADLHRERGVDFRLGRSVAAITSDSGRAAGVRLDDDSELLADLVVVGVGAIANTELADAAGLAVDDGVLADSALRTSDADVFVAGDIAQWEHPLLGTRVRVEHWANARSSGQAAARSMLGQEESYDVLPYFFTDQYDLGMEFAGYLGPDGYDEVVTRGEVADRRFVAYWVRNDRVIAGMNVNTWDVQKDIKALIRAGGQPAQIP
jgi:3-phenylpropionate/trans-cinnamate dioxygenase ferredoxin reductase subunit